MKRSPLKRGTSKLKRTNLNPGKVALRRTQLKRVGKRKAKSLNAEKLFREAVLERAQGTCELCLKPHDRLDAHHMCPKGRNGGDERIHNPELGRALCRPCHDAVHRGLYPSFLLPASHLDTLDQ